MFNSLEGVYTEIINSMISDLMLTRIDWCRDQLGLPEPVKDIGKILLVGE